INMEEYEAAKEQAKLDSAGGGEKACAQGIDLDVYALDELQKKGVPATNDLGKYDYTADSEGRYTLPEGQAKIVAIRVGDRFVDEVCEDGVLCGVILDKTVFYAESGGQQYDEGFITSTASDACEVTVRNVQVRRGFVLHEGHLEGRLRVNDSVKLSVNAIRREGLMKNHTATHVLNFALRQVLGEVDQKGSLVAPEKLRFDFTAK
ncbi:hypothetical protein Ciccas_012095, partial [Cichlidogyrus casuarinus]